MSTVQNPYAAPAVHRPRTPIDTRGDLFGMCSGFSVGGHRVEVETGHWTGLEVYRVDGQERLRKRNLGWHAVEVLDVAGRRVEVRSRWYPALPVTVDVDGVG